jgi:hypothetical protein
MGTYHKPAHFHFRVYLREQQKEVNMALLKRRIKKVLKSIDEARGEGLIMSIFDMGEVTALWEQLWGSTGNYPYMAIASMVKDLREEVI